MQNHHCGPSVTFEYSKFYRDESRLSPNLIVQRPHDHVWSSRNFPVPNVSLVTRPHGMCESHPVCHVTLDNDRKKRQLPTSHIQMVTHTCKQKRSTQGAALKTPLTSMAQYDNKVVSYISTIFILGY